MYVFHIMGQRRKRDHLYETPVFLLLINTNHVKTVHVFFNSYSMNKVASKWRENTAILNRWPLSYRLSYYTCEIIENYKYMWQNKSWVSSVLSWKGFRGMNNYIFLLVKIFERYLFLYARKASLSYLLIEICYAQIHIRMIHTFD